MHETLYFPYVYRVALMVAEMVFGFIAPHSFSFRVFSVARSMMIPAGFKRLKGT
jgi:hypothetical protein